MSCHSGCHCSECHHHDEGSPKLMLFRLLTGAAIFAAALYSESKYLFVIAYFILGYDVIINALKSIKNIFNEHFLMTIATIGAFILGEFPEACAVMLFYQLGELLSDYAQDRAKDSIGALMDLRSDTAHRLVSDEIETVPSEQIVIGDIIRVLPGEKIPLDGIIRKGSAYIDTKYLTGESVPHLFNAGDEVLSGYVAGDSVIEIEVTKKYADSTASKILELLKYEKKSKSEKFITRFARFYTPFVVFLAALVALLPPIFDGNYRVWFFRSMLFLVVSCPCALVVSVPLSFFAGIGCASIKGILIKGSQSLENAAKIKNFAFDKTGTLTDGQFSVRGVKSIDLKEDEIIKYCAFCEYFSIHPIASAIKEFYGKKIDSDAISYYREFSGKGVSAIIDNHKIAVGSADFIGVDASENDTVYMSIDGVYGGSITVSDMIKSEAFDAVSMLKKLGISPVMLTGDSEKNAKTIADNLGIPFYAALLPDGKVNKLKELKKSAPTAFAGDGINDAPVLSVADIGVSMGKIGSDAAIEASDIVLTSDNLKNLPLLIRISRKTMRIVYENITLAIFVKLAVMILGVSGLASIWLAVFADVGILIITILNSLRAFLVKD